MKATPEPSATPSATPSPARVRYVFPVRGRTSYAHEHHDYPATDIMAPCGAVAVAPVDGIVLDVTRIDTYEPRKNAGATRGGLSISILGADGARYYGSHYSLIEPDVVPGVTVSAGQPVARVGRTGDASACHLHFGISPVCARHDDWWTRRGAVWPWPYLDAWRSGTQRSPRTEVAAWQTRHGCPTKPLTDP